MSNNEGQISYKEAAAFVFNISDLFFCITLNSLFVTNDQDQGVGNLQELHSLSESKPPS